MAIYIVQCGDDSRRDINWSYRQRPESLEGYNTESRVMMSLAVLTCCPWLKERSCSEDCPCFPFLFWRSVVPCGKSGRLAWIRQSSHKSSSIPISTSVCSVFVCPNNGFAASVWDFLRVRRCWCVWLHTWAVRTPYESLHWKLTLPEQYQQQQPQQYF